MVLSSWLQPHRSVSKWHGHVMMGCKTPLQILIVLPSLCFWGNSLLPSGSGFSLSSSNGFLYYPSLVSFIYLDDSLCHNLLRSLTFLCCDFISTPVFPFLTVAFSLKALTISGLCFIYFLLSIFLSSYISFFFLALFFWILSLNMSPLYYAPSHNHSQSQSYP